MIVFYDQLEIRDVQKKQQENKFDDIEILKNNIKMSDDLNGK